MGLITTSMKPSMKHSMYVNLIISRIATKDGCFFIPIENIKKTMENHTYYSLMGYTSSCIKILYASEEIISRIMGQVEDMCFLPIENKKNHGEKILSVLP